MEATEMVVDGGLTGSNRKQVLKVDDHNCGLKATSQPQDDQNRPALSILDSPRLLRHLLTNSVENEDTPTSMLDTKLIFSRRSPSVFDKKAISSPRQSTGSKRIWENSESSAIGLMIISSVDNDLIESPKITTRGSVFGSHLRIQVPPASPTTPSSDTEFSRSPFDFGTKTRSSSFYSPSSSFRKQDTPKVLTRQLSVTDMELSEDYTCVISHGPNPKTTHIFDNFVVESYSGFLSPLRLKRSDSFLLPPDAHIQDDASGGSTLQLHNNCEKSPGCVKDSIDTDAYYNQDSCQKSAKH